MPTTKDGVGHILHLLALEAFHPGNKQRRIRWGLALVGRRNDNDGAVLWNLLVSIVQWRDRRGPEAVPGRIGSDPLGQSLASATVRAIKYGKRLASRSRNVGRRLPRHGVIVLRRKLAGKMLFQFRRGHAVPEARFHVEVLGLDGHCLLDLEVVVGVVQGKVEVLEEHS